MSQAKPMVIETLPKLFKRTSELYPDIVFQMARENGSEFRPILYKDGFQFALNFGAGLLTVGVSREDKIGLISDNRKEWLQADMGLLAIGAIDVPRGCDASPSDIQYILSFTECKISIAENTGAVKKILSVIKDIPTLKKLICFDTLNDEVAENAKNAGIEILYFSDVLEAGKKYRSENPGVIEAELEKGQPDDLATLIFTSGTTGTPKGVMLTHRNFFPQLDELRERIWLRPGEKALLVLPVWHVYERSVEYVILCQGATFCYSKPIGSILLPDMQEINPVILPAVPRVYEAIYDGIYRKMKKSGKLTFSIFRFFTGIGILHGKVGRRLLRKNSQLKYDFLPLWWIFYAIFWLLLTPLRALGNALVFKKIKSMLGKKFRAGVAGGGAYPSSLDNFFWGIGIKVVEGYGLTETAPIISVRPIDNPIFGNIGKPLRGIQCRIVDENGNILGRCKKGILEIKGDNVMKGYYKQPELTEKILSADGWLNTGDIAVFTRTGELILKGRAKDTIVLRGGENVEPLPIEMKIMESPVIKTAVVVGQDQRVLTCLIIPEKEEILSFAQKNGVAALTGSETDYSKLLKNEKVYKFVQTEIASRINNKNGFRPFELINKFTLLEKDFEMGKELSSKQEISRYKIAEIYKKEIAQMYK